MVKANDYWDKRERDWIDSQIRKDIDFDKAIASKYDQLELQMYKEVQSFYVNYAKSQNITFEEAKKRVSQFDVNAFSKEAAQLVKDKDFSPEANDRLKLYNATMRINRQQMLASELGLEAAKVSNNYEGSLRDKLEKDIYDEAKHQAGILGKTVPEKMDLRVKTLVDSSYQGAKWSDRLWVNNDQLVNALDDIVNKSLIQGMNPSQLASRLRPYLKNAVSNAKYAAQRLARTESSRVSTEYKQGLYKDEGFDKGKWIAEPSACKFCLPKDGKIYDLDDINIPYHANCRCSFVPYIDGIIASKGVSGQETDSSNGDELYPELNLNQKKDFVKAMKSIGFEKVQTTGLNVDIMNKIYNKVSSFYNEYPQMDGYIKQLKVSHAKYSQTVASAGYDKKLYVEGTMKPVLTVNANRLLNSKKMVEENVNSGWWSQKQDFTGLIQHEIGHFINDKRNYAKFGIDAESVDISNPALRKVYIAATNSLNAHKVDLSDVTEAFKKLNIEYNADNVQKYISKYALSSPAETVAEAVSDENPNDKVSNEIKKIVKKELNKLDRTTKRIEY